MLRQRRPRQHLASHLDFIRSLPCLICKNDIQTEAAHVRFSDGSIAKPMSGMSMKPDDIFTVPLCSKHHHEQTIYGDERGWWESKGIDPVKVSLALYVATGDFGRGVEVVSAVRGT